MGHKTSIGTECGERNPLALALDEQRAWDNLIPGRALANAISFALLTRFADGVHTHRALGHRFSLTQLKNASGAKLRTLQDQASELLAALQDEENTALRTAISVVVVGYRGGPETEFLVFPQADWPNCAVRALEVDGKREVRVLESKVNRGVRVFKRKLSAFRVAKREVRALLCTSTAFLENPSDSLSKQPSHPPTKAGRRASLTEPQEALRAALVAVECPSDLAETAARACPTVRHPERLALLLASLEPLLAAIAAEKGVRSPHRILACRVRSGEAYGQALALQGRVRDLRPETAKPSGGSLRLVARPVPMDTPSGDAVEAYARLAEEVERREPGTMVDFYGPCSLVGNDLVLDRPLLPGHESLFSEAAAAVGLRLVDTISGQKIG